MRFGEGFDKAGQGFKADPVRLYPAGAGVVENPKATDFDLTLVAFAPSIAGDGLVQAARSSRQMGGSFCDMLQGSPVRVNGRLNLAIEPVSGQSAGLK